MIKSVSAQSMFAWEPVPGADHYVVSIREDGRVIVETKSKTTSLPVFMPTGDYEFKIKVVGPFGKAVSETEWVKVRIRKITPPFIVDVSPKFSSKGERPRLEVRTVEQHALDIPIQFSLISPTRKKELPLEVAENGNLGPKTLLLVSKKRYFEEGEWSLRMRYLDGKEDTIEDVVQVLGRLKTPRIKTRNFVLGKSPGPLVFKTRGLDGPLKFYIEGPKSGVLEIPTEEIKLAENRKKKPGRIEINPVIRDDVFVSSLDLNSLDPGWYSLIVENVSGKTVSRKWAFRILPPPVTNEQIAEQSQLAVDENLPQPPSQYPWAAYVGYNAILKLGQSNFDNSFLGFGAGISGEFQNDLLRRIPAFKGFRWEVAFDYSLRFDTTISSQIIVGNGFHLLFGLQYIGPFDFPLNPFARVGIGTAVSTYRVSTTSGNGPSTRPVVDAAFRLGLGMQLDIGQRFFLTLTCDFFALLNSTRTDLSLRPRIEGGFRW